MMFDMDKEKVLTTEEAVNYLKICKATYLKYVHLGGIRAVKAGNGWRVHRSELYRFLVRKVDFPKGYLSAGCFSNPSSLEGRVTVFPAKVNEPIFESRLAPMNLKGGGVAAAVDSRKRAVAIKIDRTTVASGSIQAGNRVDVLVTLIFGNTFSPVAKTILENIRVLAVGREVDEKFGKGEKPASADVITLEVTPEEAEKLGLATNEGKLLLALRNYNDTDHVLTTGIQMNTLLSSYSSGPVIVSERVSGKDEKGKKEKSGGKKSPTYTVQLIKGSKVEEVKLHMSEKGKKTNKQEFVPSDEHKKGPHVKPL